jgi:hypothetical protein
MHMKVCWLHLGLLVGTGSNRYSVLNNMPTCDITQQQSLSSQYCTVYGLQDRITKGNDCDVTQPWLNGKEEEGKRPQYKGRPIEYQMCDVSDARVPHIYADLYPLLFYMKLITTHKSKKDSGLKLHLFLITFYFYFEIFSNPKTLI